MGRPDSVLSLSGDRERGQLCLDKGGGVEWLLVALARKRFVSATRGGLAGEARRRPARLVAEPPQRLEADVRQLGTVERVPADDQRLRQPGVVVGELVLEPAPFLRRRALVRKRELVDEPSQLARGSRVEPVGVEAGEAEHGVRGGPQRDVTRDGPDESVEQILRRPDKSRDPRGGENLTERPGGATDVVAHVRLVEPAAVVAHEVAHAALPGGIVQEGE